MKEIRLLHHDLSMSNLMVPTTPLPKLIVVPSTNGVDGDRYYMQATQPKIIGKSHRTGSNALLYHEIVPYFADDEDPAAQEDAPDESEPPRYDPDPGVEYDQNPEDRCGWCKANNVTRCRHLGM